MTATKKTILVIDDDQMMRLFLEQYVGQEYDVESMENGAEALNRLNKQPAVHLVIADLDMPELDGFAFTERLRSDTQFDRLPLIILSGTENSEDRVRCLKLGADDFVAKPFNPEELMARIANLFRRLG